MSVIQAKIQTVEDMYRLVRTAVVSKRPLRAIYHSRDRWFCPHRLGRNNDGRIRVLCYQYGGGRGRGVQKAGSPAASRWFGPGETRKRGVVGAALPNTPHPSPPPPFLAARTQGRAEYV